MTTFQAETSELAKAARRKYQREWRARNRERVRLYNTRYWEKRGWQNKDLFKEDETV